MWKTRNECLRFHKPSEAETKISPRHKRSNTVKSLLR